MTWLPRALLGLAVFGMVAPALAQPEASGSFQHYSDKARGWFWKEKPPPEPELPAPPPPLIPTAAVAAAAPASAASAPPAGPKPLSSAWIKENLPKYLDAAIDDPTPDKVSAYHYLQKYAMDASERFANVYQRVSLSDPNLDGTVSRPTWNQAGFALDDAAEKETARTLRALSKDFGIWFFFRSDCEACHIALPALQGFAFKYGFTVYPISIDGKSMPNSPFKDFKVDKGQAQRLGVQFTPAIYLVRPPSTFISISQGLVSATELETRVVELGTQAGVIPEEQYRRTRADRKVLLPSSASAAVSDKDRMDEPAFVRDELKRMLRRR